MRVILALFFLFGCQSSPEKKPTVLVSIVPFAYMVQKIADDNVNVEIFVPRGADPHAYEPTPKQVETAHRAKLWLRIGEPFEERVLAVLKRSSTKTVEMWQELPLLPLEKGTHAHCAHEAEDRHVWLSPRLVKIQATRIFEELSQIIPEKKELFKKNLVNFVRDLDELDLEISKRLAPMKDQAILVSHAAFGYFCRDYHLTQLALECEGKEGLPQKISKTLHDAENMAVRCAIVQGQYGSKAVALVAEKLHLPIFLSDPYAWDYLDNLRTLSKAIARETENPGN